MKIRAIVVLTVGALLAGPVWAGGDAAKEQFGSFCEEWMQKLESREKRNKTIIEWKRSSAGVQGEYVGYSRDHRCEVKPTTKPGQIPIGKITYREVKYRHTGASADEALRKVPRPVEAYEVTEIFRYSGGKWVY